MHMGQEERHLELTNPLHPFSHRVPFMWSCQKYLMYEVCVLHLTEQVCFCALLFVV